MKGEDLTLGEIRRTLHELVAVADSAERPRPTRVNDASHPMPDFEWELYERSRPYGDRDFLWSVRVPDELPEVDGGLVYVSSPVAPEDFTPLFASDARRLGMASLAAADRAGVLSAGVVRLEDHRKC